MVFLPHRLSTPSHALLSPPLPHPAESISVTHMCVYVFKAEDVAMDSLVSGEDRFPFSW